MLNNSPISAISFRSISSGLLILFGVSPQTVNYHISQALRTLGVALKDYLPLLLWLLSLSGRNDLV